MRSSDSGEADAAVIPTCELENISNARLFKVIDEEKTSLSCKSSSPLYPDFVFSSFPDASPEVVKNFTVSLLTMPKMPDGASWGIAKAVNKLTKPQTSNHHTKLRALKLKI